MNLAVGLTPAWQHILVFDRFRVDAVNRAREAYWVASGKVLNAGIALHRLGGPSETLALLGGRPLEPITAEFEELGVPHRWVVSRAETRVCTTILDEGKGTDRTDAGDGRLQMTELVENARPLGPGEYEAFLAAYEEEAPAASAVVMTGSLPAGTPSVFYRELLARTPGRVVLDIRGDELRHALDARPFLVKPNREELGKTLGRDLATDEELRDGMRELATLGAEWVVVSQGRRALWAYSVSGGFLRIRPPVVPARNPIGCGDCLAAGIAWGISRGRPVPEALRLGVAAAAQNLQDVLPSRLDPETVEGLAAGLEVEPVPA